MKFLKFKINILSLAILSISILGCDSNEDTNVNAGSNLEARFITDLDFNVVKFINLSQDASSYIWDFGDGTTSTLFEPQPKTYFEDTNLTISLTAFDEEGNSEVFTSQLIIDLPCNIETSENIDPALGDLNWTFSSADGQFDAFGSIGGAIVNNPMPDSVNESCSVYQYSKTAGCQTWSGVGIELPSALDFSTLTNKIFKMKVFAETQLTDVTLRLEFMPFPNVNPFQERIASITQMGQWQELTFDFTNVSSGTFKSMIIYFERNAPCDGDVYYFDDIVQE